MRLYLSSFRMGSCPDRLVAMAGVGREIAVIANAMDAEPPDQRAAGVEREVVSLAELDLSPTEVDLREHFDRPADVADVLRPFGAVWLRGGNVFMLRHALARSGADAVLTQMLRRDEVVYAGYSAGPCVLAPRLDGLDAVDPPGVVTRVYGDEPRRDGLGLLDYAIVPHVDSPDHPESEACGRVAERYRAQGLPHRVLRDGQVLVIDGDDEHVCG